MSLTIEQWAAVAEIVGGIAVLISLIYLASQIRQNTKQLEMNLKSLRLNAFERTVESGNRVREILITDGEVAELFLQGLKDYASLPGVERFRVNMLLRNVFSEFQSAYVRQLAWNEEHSGPAGQAAFLDGLLGQAGIRQWLDREDMDWHPDFRKFVDERLEARAPTA